MSFLNYRKKRKRWMGVFFADYPHPGHHHHRHSHDHSSGRRYRRKRRGQMVGIGAFVLVLLVVVGIGSFYYLKTSGKRNLLQASATDVPELGESGLVSHNGRKYRYKDEIINILCMGIDQHTAEDEAEEQGEGKGQADTIFLLTLDEQEHSLQLTGISRDTMTAVKTYDHQGNYIGETKNHLGLAYAFGDGDKMSGALMTEAVSKLMYGLPIHGYAAVRMDAIQKLNDSVGGVRVTLPEDIVLGGEEFAQGDIVRLQGSQAQDFVRSRDMYKEGSNNLRMERQKLYATAFIGEAKKALKKNPMLAADLYRNLTEDMVTSIGLDEAVYLASLLPGMDFSLDDICMLKGGIRQGAVYEEFYVDEDALMDTILATFYTEVDS